MNHKNHKEEAKKRVKDVRFSIYVVSTSRFRSLQKGEKIEDVSGELATKIIKTASFTVLTKRIIPDSRRAIIRAIEESIKQKADVVLFIGGTGITWDDATVEALELMLKKKIDGFGELFRYLSYQEIGASAMLSRAIAGLYDNLIVFAVPGSPSAVRLALEKLILPEIRHIVYLAKLELVGN